MINKDELTIKINRQKLTEDLRRVFGFYPFFNDVVNVVEKGIQRQKEMYGIRKWDWLTVYTFDDRAAGAVGVGGGRNAERHFYNFNENGVLGSFPDSWEEFYETIQRVLDSELHTIELRHISAYIEEEN